MTTTVRMKASQIYKDWHVIDAAGRPLGRVATEAATLLRGKHKPTYEPHLDDGDFVIIINASQVKVTGNKANQIKYHSHSGYPGGLRTRSYAVQLERFPERVIEKAVWGMLPGGSLGEAIMKHLKVYRGANHPHTSQIVGSERARAAREAADAETLTETRKPPRLRPLTSAAPAQKAMVAATPVPLAKATPVASPAPVEEPVVAPEPEVQPIAEAPDVVEAAPPKRRAPRKKVEEPLAESAPEAPAAAAEEATEKKPARRTAAKQEE